MRRRARRQLGDRTFEDDIPLGADIRLRGLDPDIGLHALADEGGAVRGRVPLDADAPPGKRNASGWPVLPPLGTPMMVPRCMRWDRSAVSSAAEKIRASISMTTGPSYCAEGGGPSSPESTLRHVIRGISPDTCG